MSDSEEYMHTTGKYECPPNDDMVEKLCRVLCEFDYQEEEDIAKNVSHYFQFKGQPEKYMEANWHKYRGKAIKLLKAMHHPTDYMRNQGGKKLHGGTLRIGDVAHSKDAMNIFQAMILGGMGLTHWPNHTNDQKFPEVN